MDSTISDHRGVRAPLSCTIMTSVQTKQMGLSKESIIECLRESYGESVTSAEVKAYCQMNDFNYQTITNKLTDYKVGRGKWNLTVTEKLEQTYQAPAALPAIEQNLIPQKDDSFVSFGNFSDVKKIIKSGIFYPTFITGLSGNGKTFSVEQACAQLGRELIRVNITIETDEDDLIGGFRLVDGATVWHNGPVIEALQRGAILLLDEIDLASNKILCLQSILEGNGVFLKKIGQFVRPSAGFNVIATANTKGKGSDDGRFIGTNVLNEAFLERFPVTFEQEYPTAATEQKILNKICDDAEFCKRLSDWADIIRKTFYDGGIEEIISTRRLVHIVKAYSIFNDKAKAIQVCVNRFDDETKQAFLELYDKVDADFVMPIDEEMQS
ncbi:porphyrin biosynthesis [Synechococcus phage S-SM2]|uniref:Putative cobalt chelatase subunit CobS n=1 Tax=Synechococcus phage S-SM2 TaxID=444860 RepID=E3SJ29_9CAUD|nr:porphyrin biosynthesis [Synechococcus phage S-SM2]ADO97477.1 putative cobalt chelatase subunit CobS [Synechococcus phage S-SM2]